VRYHSRSQWVCDTITQSMTPIMPDRGRVAPVDAGQCAL